MELIMIYDHNGEKPKTMYRVLSFVVYSLIDRHVCIYYISCQSKTLRYIYYKPLFEDIVSIYYSVFSFQNCY